MKVSNIKIPSGDESIMVDEWTYGNVSFPEKLLSFVVASLPLFIATSRLTIGG